MFKLYFYLHISENFDKFILSQQNPTKYSQEGHINMRKQVLNMQTLINKNKEEILSNEKEIKRIEKQIDDKHIDYGVIPSTNKSVNLLGN